MSAVHDARELIAQQLKVEPAELQDTCGPATVPAWDSIGHMRIILAVESKIGRQLATDEVLSAFTVRDIARILTDGAP